jgi:hypothetical protein
VFDAYTERKSVVRALIRCGLRASFWNRDFLMRPMTALRARRLLVRIAIGALTLLSPGCLLQLQAQEAQNVKARWRAQQIATRKAEAEYHNARLAREIAEITVREYLEGLYSQEIATINGEIALAESDLQRAQDQLDRARRMDEKGFIPVYPKGVEELSVKKARFALEQARSKKKVLVDYTRPKRIKALKSEVEKARADELAKKAAWELEKSKESALEREVIRTHA